MSRYDTVSALELFFAGKRHRFPLRNVLLRRLSHPARRPLLLRKSPTPRYHRHAHGPTYSHPHRCGLFRALPALQSVEDQRHLRDLVAASDGIAFVADGSVLPRRSGSDDRPMEAARGAVPFESPESFRREFRLPHRGVVKGMLVPRGVTVIVGGGYHGKLCGGRTWRGVAGGLDCCPLGRHVRRYWAVSTTATYCCWSTLAY